MDDDEAKPKAAVAPVDTDGGQPLYVQLAHTLSERIAAGEYAVGELLPTEAELGVTFGVSRYTVRQAIQHLRQQGLVSARKGIGTRVDARRVDQPSYSHAIQSLQELLQFAHETRLDVIGIEEVEARGALAELLGCRPGKRWMRIEGIRHGEEGERPICHSLVFLDTAYKALAADRQSLRTAIWSLIEERFGETVVEVDQRIDAVILDDDRAGQLMAAPGSPALKFVRRFYVTGRRLVELAVSLHPADRFAYHMTLRRGRG